MAEPRYTSMQKEYWIDFLVSMLRKVLFAVGLELAHRGWVTTEQANGLTSIGLLEFLASAIFTGGVIVWQNRKSWFNVVFPRAALRADPKLQNIAAVKAEVLIKAPGTSDP